MKKSLIRLLALALVFGVSACAHLIHGDTDQITIRSSNPQAKIYVNNDFVGVGHATTTVHRGSEYTILAEAPGCQPAKAKTGYKFDKVSLLSLPIDAGIVSIRVYDMKLTNAAWATDPLSYSVNPVCSTPAQLATQPENEGFDRSAAMEASTTDGLASTASTTPENIAHRTN